MRRLSRYVWRRRLHRNWFYQLQGIVYLGLLILFLKLSSKCFYLPTNICERSVTPDSSPISGKSAIIDKDIVKADRAFVTTRDTRPEKQSRTLISNKFLQLGISESERSIFNLLLRAFVQVVPSDVAYFMYGGTLLGSYRHHGMIPWDDDIDLLVRETDKGRLLRVLQNLKPEFLVDIQNDTMWKFFHKTSTPGRNNWGAWPFVDIFFFEENSTHIWDTSRLDNDIYWKITVFPLIMRPFMDFMLPAPRYTKEFLETTFDIEKCVTHSWSHKHQAHINPYLATSCESLHSVLPFVHREYGLNKTLEVVKGDSERQSIVFSF